MLTLTGKSVDSTVSGQRVLVTGINGFTGAYVKKLLLERGHEVHGLVIDLPNSEKDHRASLLDKEALLSVVENSRPTSVIHLAAVSSVTHVNVEEMYEANILGTRNLIDTLSSSGFGKNSVILASSANVYGNVSTGRLSEDALPSPENDYAVSKLAMESMSKLWSDKLPITITRPFNYTGVGQSTKFLIPKIVEHFKRRESTIQLGNIDVFRDFSDVRSVAWAYVQLCERPAPGETFNISSGTGTSVSQVISLLKELTGHSIKVEVNPAFVREHEVKSLVGDSSKLWNYLGRPSEISLKETLQWMLQN
jgi:nucleoside-diphosphate-sugar epimerase